MSVDWRGHEFGKAEKNTYIQHNRLREDIIYYYYYYYLPKKVGKVFDTA